MSCKCDELAGDAMDLAPVCIGHLWIFQDLAPEEITALSKDAKRQKLKKGDLLFRQDDNVDEMFLIKAGRIKMDKFFEDGSQITLDIRKAGDFLGESMFSEQGTYPVSATCIEDTLTCGFTRTAFEEKILAYPNIGLQIIKTLSNRINHLTGRIGSMAATSIEDRLFRVLSNVAKEHGKKKDHGVEIRFPLTHEDLSFLIGAHRVSITRAMKTLKDSGRILLKDKFLILPAL
jgi:CRP/FNR family transcriptional regulator